MPPPVVMPLYVRVCGKLTQADLAKLTGHVVGPVRKIAKAAPLTDAGRIEAAMAAQRWDDAYHLFNGLSLAEMRVVYRQLSRAGRAALEANLDRSGLDRQRMFLGIQQVKEGNWAYWNKVSQEVFTAIRYGRYTDAYWLINKESASARADIMHFLHWTDLYLLYQEGERQAKDAGIPHYEDIRAKITAELRRRKAEPPPAVPELAGLRAPQVTFSVTGNHSGEAAIVAALKEGVDKALGVPLTDARPVAQIESGLVAVPAEVIGEFRQRDGELQYVVPADQAKTVEKDVVTTAWAGEFPVIANPGWWLGSGQQQYYRAGGTLVETGDVVRAVHWGQLFFGARGFVVRKSPRTAGRFQAIAMTTAVVAKDFAETATGTRQFVKHDTGTVIVLVLPGGEPLYPENAKETPAHDNDSQVVTDVVAGQTIRALIGRPADKGVSELIVGMNRNAFKVMTVDDRRRTLRQLVSVGGEEASTAIVEIVSSSRDLDELNELARPLRTDGTLARLFGRADMPVLRLFHAVGTYAGATRMTWSEIIRFFFEFSLNPLRDPIRVLTAVWDWLKTFAHAAESLPQLPGLLVDVAPKMAELGKLVHRAQGTYRTTYVEGERVVVHEPGDAAAQRQLSALAEHATKALTTAWAGFEYINRLGAHEQDPDTATIGEIGRGLRYAMLIEAASNLVGDIGMVIVAGKAIGTAVIAEGGIKAVGAVAGVLRHGVTRRELLADLLELLGRRTPGRGGSKKAELVVALHGLRVGPRTNVDDIVDELIKEKLIGSALDAASRKAVEQAKVTLDEIHAAGNSLGHTPAEIDHFIRQLSAQHLRSADELKTAMKTVKELKGIREMLQPALKNHEEAVLRHTEALRAYEAVPDPGPRPEKLRRELAKLYNDYPIAVGTRTAEVFDDQIAALARLRQAQPESSAEAAYLDAKIRKLTAKRDEVAAHETRWTAESAAAVLTSRQIVLETAHLENGGGLYDILRSYEGVNFRAKAKNVAYDELLGPHGWPAVVASLLAEGKVPPKLSVDHIYPVAKIADLLDPIWRDNYHVFSGERQKQFLLRLKQVQEVPANLVRMRMDANGVKGATAWPDIDLTLFESRYKYDIAVMQKYQDEYYKIALRDIVAAIEQIKRDFNIR